MAFYNLLTWRTTLSRQLPNGANLNVEVMNEAIRNAVAYCGSWVRDIVIVDFVGDGVTQRYALTGTDVELLPQDQQETPTFINTAGIVAPTAASVPTASGAGSTFAAGLHYTAYSFTTPIGETTISTPYQEVTLTAGQNVVFPAITLTTGATGIRYYVSPGPLNADILLAGTSTTGAQKTLTAPPTTTASRPLVNYLNLFQTFFPIRDLEQNIAVDGASAVDTSTLTLTTVPTLGQRFRVVYSREPVLPVLDADIIRIPEQVMREAAVTFCAKAFSVLHESGDTTMWLSLFDRGDAFLQDMQKKDLPTMQPRPRIVEET